MLRSLPFRDLDKKEGGGVAEEREGGRGLGGERECVYRVSEVENRLGMRTHGSQLLFASSPSLSSCMRRGQKQQR